MSSELLASLRRLLRYWKKMSTLNVSSGCAKVLAKLAVSMRTDFAVMVPKVMPIAFDKLKEKKAVLRNELVELCDSSATTTSLENYTEAVCGGLTKPNPQSRAQTALFVARLLSRHDSVTVPILSSVLSDADAEVREASFRAMGAILRCIGEQGARRLFGEVAEDKLKMAKITENFEKIREEFGDKAAPEIIRLHSAELKPKPLQTSSAPAMASSTSLETRKAAPAPRAPVRAPGSAPRPSTAVSRPTNRTATQSAIAPTNRMPARPTTAPKRPNVVSATTARLNTPVRAPLSTRPTQSATPRPFSDATKPSVARPGLSARPPVKTVFAPNVVRTSTSSTKPAPSAPVKIISNPSSGAVPAVPVIGSLEGPPKITAGLPRSNSGMFVQIASKFQHNGKCQ
ncbi:HEAT repeat protein, partial [Ostertagia ostertagi]